MGSGLSQSDVQELLKEGYSMSEIQDAVREVEQEELQESYNYSQNRTDPRMYAQQSAFMSGANDNLIKWQLELDNILERAEHILRGDKLVTEGGHLIWRKQDNPINEILNDYGVQEVMRILSMYLNRNTILSDYDAEEIREKVLDFGRELNDLFFMKYEEMGLTVKFEQAFQHIFETTDKLIFSKDGRKITVAIRTSNGLIQFLELSENQINDIDLERERLSLEKRKNYPMLVREIVDIVHSAYKRALEGGERRSLREARQVTQTEPLYGNMGGGVTINTGGMQRQRGVLNPMRYLMGKNK
jgi:hypothetical protein